MENEMLLVAPHLTLALGGLALVAAGAFAGKSAFQLVRFLSVLILAAAGYAVWHSGAMVDTVRAYDNMVAVNGFAQVMMTVLMVLGGLGILQIGAVPATSPLRRFELPVLMVFSLLGMAVLVTANDLLVVYLGLELMSFPLYVLAAMNRNASKSSEAGLKYFVLGAVASGLFLFGASFLYGATGSTQFDVMAAAISAGKLQSSYGIVLVVAIAFLLSGFAFKVSAVPFHMWTPDVYQGAPLVITSFFAGAPKVAAMGLIILLLFGPLGEVQDKWGQIIALLAGASMLVGGFGGVNQNSIKRILAYSSISNMGYVLLAVLAGDKVGVAAAVMYLIIYGLMTAGTFALLLQLRTKDGDEIDALSAMKGLSVEHKPTAYALAVLMFAMSGLPPMAGFFGKLEVFQAAVQADLIGLSVLGILTSVVAAYYYLNVIRVLFFELPDEHTATVHPVFGTLCVALVSLAFVVLFPLFPQVVAQIADAAAGAIH